MKNEVKKHPFSSPLGGLCFFSGNKLRWSPQGWSFSGKKGINMLPSMSSSWLYTLLVNMCKQQQVIDSKQAKNNSRIEIYKDLYGKRFLV